MLHLAMPSLTLLLLTLFACVPGRADKFTYPANKLSAAGIQEVKVSGVKGRLRLTGGNSKYFVIKITHSKGKHFEDWHLSIDRQGGALVLEVFNVAYGPQWRTLVREELWPEFDIEIEGPSRPAVLSWREGELEIINWKSGVEAAFLNGRFKARGMRGDLHLQAVDSAVNISDHVGRLVLKGEKGRVEMAGIQGRVEFNWLQGTLHAQNLKGPAVFEMPSGNVVLRNMQGKLVAKGISSNWDIGASAANDLEVVTDSGPVRIRWNGGGAKIFLSSAKGSIRVPKPLLVESREGAKVVEATQAKTPRGLVFVRTQSGAIVWQ